jgi:hypothetical protein
MDESRVNFGVQEPGPAIMLVMQIGYLKWLSWLCDRVLNRIHAPLCILIMAGCSCGRICSSFLHLQFIRLHRNFKP